MAPGGAQDEGIDRIYLELLFSDGTNDVTYTEPTSGDETLCVAPDGTGGYVPVFANDLTTLGIPSLDDIDQDLQDGLWCVAENGVTDEGC